MCEYLPSNPVERDEDRQMLTCCARRSAVLLNQRVGPTKQHIVCLLGLRCQDQDVVDIEVDLLRTGDCGQMLGDILIGRTQSKATLPQSCQMIAAGYQDDVASDQPQPAAQRSADRSCTENDVARHVSQPNLALL
jgi:hypothetical protein